MTTLLSLVGEQPIPNLLVARAVKADRNILCFSATTKKVSGRLCRLLPGAEEIELPPYDLSGAIEVLNEKCPERAIVNLTGGTKPMSLAAYEVTRLKGLPFVYLQSEGHRSLLHQSSFENGLPLHDKTELLGPLFTIHEYLQAHGLPNPHTQNPANAQERGLRQWLEKEVDECLSFQDFSAFEIDFILRRGNQVAIMEAKMKVKNTREGIDQLSTAGGRSYLGTYIGKLLVLTKPLGRQLSELAQARNVRVVEVEGDLNPQTGRWVMTQTSQHHLRQALKEVLGPI